MTFFRWTHVILSEHGGVERGGGEAKNLFWLSTFAWRFFGPLS